MLRKLMIVRIAAAFGMISSDQIDSFGQDRLASWRRCSAEGIAVAPNVTALWRERTAVFG